MKASTSTSESEGLVSRTVCSSFSSFATKMVRQIETGESAAGWPALPSKVPCGVSQSIRKMSAWLCRHTMLSTWRAWAHRIGAAREWQGSEAGPSSEGRWPACMRSSSAALRSDSQGEAGPPPRARSVAAHGRAAHERQQRRTCTALPTSASARMSTMGPTCDSSGSMMNEALCPLKKMYLRRGARCSSERARAGSAGSTTAMQRASCGTAPRLLRCCARGRRRARVRRLTSARTAR